MAKKEIIDQLKKFIVLLKTEGISVKKAFLYGSYSTNKNKNNSDIDIMIVTSDEDANDDMIAAKAWQLTKKISTKIEPFIIGLKSFNSTNESPLISIVKKDGIRIV